MVGMIAAGSDRFELRVDHALGGYCIVGRFRTRRAAIDRATEFWADPDLKRFRVIDLAGEIEPIVGNCALFPRIADDLPICE